MNKIIHIEKAKSEDFNSIQILFGKMFEIFHIDQDVNWPFTKSGIDYLNNSINNKIALVAKDENKIVGFATGGISETMPFQTYKNKAYLENLFVLSEYRNTNIGRELTINFIKIAKEFGVDRIHTDSDNDEKLKRFYDSLGFEIIGVNYQLKI